MISFFFSHIRTHLFRNISMFLVSGICVIALTMFLFFYQNIAGALLHFNYNIVDEHRFTLRSDTNFFTLFSKNSSWLPSTLVSELIDSNRFEKIQSFSLVELPVLAKFSLFSFGLETDIPVFSVTDGVLVGSGIPIGISRSMVDFYNVQFAGSSPMFPKVSEAFIKGQSVEITFGASKIFPSLSRIATPITGNIVRIGDDFPGFWIVIPESIVKSKMQEIGYNLGPPYKIVAYMKDINDRSMVATKYADYNPEFDSDSIAKFREQIFFLRNIFLGISLIISGILGIFFIILLFSFFRERRDVFRIVYIFGLSGIRARILTLAEPIFLLGVGSFSGLFFGYWIVWWLAEIWRSELLHRGIVFPLLPPSSSSLVIICILVCLIFGFIILILESVWRKKSLMR